MAQKQEIPASHPEHIDWWHQIELPDGYVTPGHDRSASKLASLRLPSLKGKTVLDVGAYDGYFSFAAERLGASRVVALDTYVWQQPGGKDGFEYARAALGSKVEDLEVEVLDISPETVGKFDVVLFLGVLYHMRHPLLSLEQVASVTEELLVVETLTDLAYLRLPAAAFYPWPMLHEQTNWWGPNQAAVLGMLSSVGFQRVAAYPAKRITRERLQNIPGRVKVRTEWVSLTPKGSRFRLMRDFAKSALTQNRLVAHGWK
jgi:tRNA (mo5U34)-methyltransferase